MLLLLLQDTLRQLSSSGSLLLLGVNTCDKVAWSTADSLQQAHVRNTELLCSISSHRPIDHRHAPCIDYVTYSHNCSCSRPGQTVVLFVAALQAQQQQLERAEAAYHRSNARLHEIQQQLERHGGASSDGDVDGSKLLDVLRDDVAHLRQQVSSTHNLDMCACFDSIAVWDPGTSQNRLCC